MQYIFKICPCNKPIIHQDTFTTTSNSPIIIKQQTPLIDSPIGRPITPTPSKPIDIPKTKKNKKN